MSKKRLKTFNLDEEIYSQFSKHCKEQGLSMSKKIENFILEELSKLKSQSIKPQENKERHSFSKYC